MLSRRNAPFWLQAYSFLNEKKCSKNVLLTFFVIIVKVSFFFCVTCGKLKRAEQEVSSSFLCLPSWPS